VHGAFEGLEQILYAIVAQSGGQPHGAGMDNKRFALLLARKHQSQSQKMIDGGLQGVGT